MSCCSFSSEKQARLRDIMSIYNFIYLTLKKDGQRTKNKKIIHIPLSTLVVSRAGWGKWKIFFVSRGLGEIMEFYVRRYIYKLPGTGICCG